jgi:hemoglobin
MSETTIAATRSYTPTAPSHDLTLYDKLGGHTSIKAVVDEFYVRVLADARLTPYFQGADLARLKRHQALFISQALGGPRQYDGRDMAAAHQHLGISDAHFDAVAGHLADALAALGVGGADIDTIIGVVGALRDQVVARQAPAPAASDAPSLYEKLGGEGSIRAVVEAFYARVLGDPRLAPTFAGIDLGRLKRHQALFISQALGGPKAYEGRDMFQAHKAFLISGEQFDAVAGHLVAALQQCGVGAADIDTIIAAVAPLRRDIVMNHFTRWLRGG